MKLTEESTVGIDPKSDKKFFVNALC